MVRDDILGGLNSALARGQSLRQAMMSFYNAGYQKLEIEEAARFLKSGNVQINIQPEVKTSQKNLNIQEDKNKNISQGYKGVSAYGNFVSSGAQAEQQPQMQAQFQSPIQNVSSYGQRESPKGKLAIIVLIIILFLLLLSFGAVFFFKDEIISFFSS